MDAEVKPHPEFQGIFEVKLENGTRRIATENLAPGKTVYGERLVKSRGAEYRVWDAFRSKLAAAVLKGLKRLPVESGQKVLYLGAASGTTASHVSDIVGKEGYVYCVEFAHRSIRDLINNVCRYRSNMAPVLADARFPKRYAMLVGRIDGVYCDVAQPKQAIILANNAQVFLRDGGWGMLAVKARSVDVTQQPLKVYKREAEVLVENGFVVSEVLHLEPYDKDHAMISAVYTSR